MEPERYVVLGDLGRKNRHRHRRIFVKTPGGMRPLCRVWLGLDGSAYFAFSGKAFNVGKVSMAKIRPGGHTAYDEQPGDISHLDPDAKLNPHYSLHPTGDCHLRVPGKPYVQHFDWRGWFPVTRPHTWINAFTPELTKLPVEAKKSAADPEVTVDDESLSVRVVVEILPPGLDLTQLQPPPLPGTLFAIGPHYALQVTLTLHAPVGACIFVMAQPSRPKPVPGAEGANIEGRSA